MSPKSIRGGGIKDQVRNRLKFVPTMAEFTSADSAIYRIWEQRMEVSGNIRVQANYLPMGAKTGRISAIADVNNEKKRASRQPRVNEVKALEFLSSRRCSKFEGNLKRYSPVIKMNTEADVARRHSTGRTCELEDRSQLCRTMIIPPTP
jgi:hypothetical protein